MMLLVLDDALKVETAGNLGAVEIATFLSLVLLGVSLSQGYTFFRRSGSDRWTLKLMVRVARSFLLIDRHRDQRMLRSPFFCKAFSDHPS